MEFFGPVENWALARLAARRADETGLGSDAVSGGGVASVTELLSAEGMGKPALRASLRALCASARRIFPAEWGASFRFY